MAYADLVKRSHRKGGKSTGRGGAGALAGVDAVVDPEQSGDVFVGVGDGGGMKPTRQKACSPPRQDGGSVQCARKGIGGLEAEGS